MAQEVDRADADGADGKSAVVTHSSIVRNYLGLAECPLYGNRFWQIPNSNGCFRLLAVGTLDFFERTPKRPTDLIFRPQFVGGVEVRLPTEFGTFRALATGRAVELVTRSGQGAALTDPTLTDSESQQSQSGLDRAYFEYVGLTVGRNYSFYDFSSGHAFADARVSQRITNMAGYTFNFGDAWAVTASVEDHADRRAPIVGDPTVRVSDGGRPDIIGTLRNLTTRTRVQLSVVSHVARPDSPFYAERSGYGAQLAGTLYFPEIGVPFSDRLTVSGAFAEGATSYVGFTTVPDAVALGGSLFLTRGWNVAASYLHFWSEQWSSAFTVSYASLWTGLDAPNFSSLTEQKAAANIVYRPAPEWQIGLEYSYTDQHTISSSNTRTRTDRGQLRIRYDF